MFDCLKNEHEVGEIINNGNGRCTIIWIGDGCGDVVIMFLLRTVWGEVGRGFCGSYQNAVSLAGIELRGYGVR